MHTHIYSTTDTSTHIYRTSSQGIESQADVFWSRRSERRPGEEIHVWNGEWQEVGVD